MNKPIKLYTEDNHFVAKVRPQLPLAPTGVLIWGQRVFMQIDEHEYQEVFPTVVVELLEATS